MAVVSVLVTGGAWASVLSERAELPLVAGVVLSMGAEPSVGALPDDRDAPADSGGAASAAASLDEEEDGDVVLDVGDPAEHADAGPAWRSDEAPRPEHGVGGYWVHRDPCPRPPRA